MAMRQRAFYLQQQFQKFKIHINNSSSSSSAKSRRWQTALAVTVSSSVLFASLYTREWRSKSLIYLENASHSKDLLLSRSNAAAPACSELRKDFSSPITDPTTNKRATTATATTTTTTTKANTTDSKYKGRELKTLLDTIQRAGLLGVEAGSVKEALQHIRRWHENRGFSGGLILRDLKEPLFYHDSICHQNNVKKITTNDSSNNLNQRECYYLYYEQMGNGELRQQVFCRGTSQLTDLGTGMQAMFLYDPDLECNVHFGFRKHADRILRDLEPLLQKTGNATVELAGHSMGGSVAIILALKLKKKGYNVVRVTTVGAPRICNARSAQFLENLLPKDTLRVEHESDIVTFWPPHGKHIGSKLLFMNNKGRETKHALDGIKAFPNGGSHARYLASSDLKKNDSVDSLWINFNILDVFLTKMHRIPSYVQNMEKLISEVENSDQYNREDSSDTGNLVQKG